MRPTLTMIYTAVTILLLAAPSHTQDEPASHWNKLALDDLMTALNREDIKYRAKNVILFVGDGMGISTLTAARIYKGQLQGRPGEEGYLEFERWPNSALVKTYNIDKMVPDSAGTATALLSGVKTRFRTLGVDHNVRYCDCSSYSADNDIPSILEHFRNEGRATGIVTTTTVTHATPAAAYAHTPCRNWESDGQQQTAEQRRCRDIARQLVDNGTDINVILGGGRTHFYPSLTPDPEYPQENGSRVDNVNLVEEWMQKQMLGRRNYQYVWNRAQFDNVNPTNTDYLLGLFEPSHMKYEYERESVNANEPTLANMTEKAIRILRKNSKGFFLLVEGGRIDHGHHTSQARIALHEALALEEAVRTAQSMVDVRDTLLIVTADHSHVFTIGGYPSRGHDLFAITDSNVGQGPGKALDQKSYTGLLYSNGPGAPVNEIRKDPITANTTSFTYLQQSAVPLPSETHGGEDVAVYAIGPMSHLFHRAHEQNYIGHVMMHASCVGQYQRSKTCPPMRNSGMLCRELSVLRTVLLALSTTVCLTARFGG